MSRKPVWRTALLAVMTLGLSGCLATPPGFAPMAVGSSPIPRPEGEKEVALPPKASAQVNVKLAENFEKSGHHAEAAVYYERAREADPKLPGVSKRLAILYDRLGQTDQAFAEFQSALKASPQDPEVLNGLGYFHYTRGQWEHAEKHLRQAIEADPQYRKAWVNLGMVCCQRQRYDEGLAAFCQAVSKAEAHSNVGFILTVQGRYDEARLEYRRALEANPNLTIARLALAKLERQEYPTSASGTGATPRS